jgi:TolB protein
MFVSAFMLFGCDLAARNPTQTQNLTAKLTHTENQSLLTPMVVTQVSTNTATIIPAHDAESLVQLTFVSESHSGFYGVYKVNVGCLDDVQPCLSEPGLLFESKNRISVMSWSPDGTKIAFVSPGKDQVDDIFIADWNGLNLVNLTNSPELEGQPTWSLDSKKLIYTYTTKWEMDPNIWGDTQLREIDLDTGAVIPVFDDLHTGIVRVPNGDQIAYVDSLSPTDGRTQIVIANLDGTVVKTLPPDTQDFTGVGEVSFSADGQRLAFMGEKLSSDVHSTDIYVINVNGSGELNLTTNLGTNFHPAWSPVGNWIAFMSNQSGDYDIYLIKADGTSLLNITSNPAIDSYPAWRLVPSP